MTLNDVLQDLIQHLESNRNSTLSWEHVREWPKRAIQAFQNAGWIKPTVPAKSVVCPGCEENCFMPVHSYPAKANQPERNFVACDVKDDMGRIPIPPEMLQQWQITENQVAQWLALELGLRGKPKRDKTHQSIQIGDMQGKKQSGRLELESTEPVSLKTLGHSLPLIEAVYFQGKKLQIDTKAIFKMVDRPVASETHGKYQPSNARREARKKDTQDRYKKWNKIYRDLKRKNPEKSDNWCALQIFNMQTKKLYKQETIRKNMKK